MNCLEFKEVAAAYALGVLDSDERAAAEAHLQQGTHEGCREAVAAARATVGALGDGVAPAKPSAGVWAGIEQQLGRQAAAAAPPVARRGGAVVPWVIAIAAAAALLLLWRDRGRQIDARRAAEQGAALAAQRSLDARKDVEVAKRELTATSMKAEACQKAYDAAAADLKLRREAVALLAQPGTKVMQFKAQDAHAGAAATAIVNVAAKRVVFVAGDMPRPSGKDYELWVIRGDQKIAAGLLRDDGSGQVVATVDPAILADGADALAVTLEPEGGGAEPRGELVMVAAMPKT